MEVTLSADLEAGQLLDFFVGSPGYAFATSDSILGKPAQSSLPTDITTAVGLKVVNNTEWDTESLYVWQGSAADKIYVALNRHASVSISISSLAGLGGGGGADNFVGARAGISPARTGQDYGTLTTITWDTEEFDVGGFFDPASNSRMTVPGGITYAVVHAGVTLGGFANTGDLFIDILKNGVSLGIGSTTKNIGISTVARTSVTTGVVEVAEGDYFELAIRVVQDGSVSLQPIGTFFSCHASSTEIGGSSPDTNDYVSAINFGLSGQDVTLTLDRTGTLPSISGSFTIPDSGGTGTDTNDYVTAGAFSLSGQDLSLQLTGTSGFPAIDIPAITLPAGGGGTDTNDYVDSFLAAVSGSDLTMTLGRTGALVDLTQTVALPAGGGGTTTTDRQRIEALAFTAVGTTTTQLQQQTLGATPSSVIYGTGGLEMVTAVAAETTFTIVNAGVYLMEWNAVITPAADRPEPCLRVLANADDALLGETDPIYIRANSEGAYAVSRAGILVVPADNTVVKAIVLNCRNDNSFSVAAGHSLHIVRGSLGAAGQDGSGGGMSEAEADARYLQLIGGTLTGPGRLTIDVDGNNEALVINHHGGLSESALHAFTNTTGAQKAMQASRSSQSTAFFSIEGSLGGGNTKPGIAMGDGTGARDTVLYRDSANNWKTPDFFTAQGFSITGTPLTTWNALGIGNTLNGPPTLAASVLTFTELDGTATDITLPTGGGAGTDTYVTNITTSIDSNNPRRFTIQLTRNEGLPTLTTAHTVPHETPTGGAAGDLLAKATAADYDFGFINPSTLITEATIFPPVNAIIEQGTGITITRDAANNAIRIASDTAPWALIANTDVIVPGKLGSGVTSPDVVLFGDGAWKTLPSPLDDISDWAHRTNFDVIPAGKLGTGTTDFSTILYGDGAFRVPGFLTAAGVYDWAEEGNVDRLPIDKMPSVLRTVSHFTYDNASRQLGMFFTNTVGISEQTQVILPDFLTASDVSDFDIHDVVTTPANIQAADRFIFSDESVAGDPMRYARADALVPYVLGQIADSDIPGTLTRDSEVETFALLAHPNAVVGYARMSPVVRGLSALIYDSPTRTVRATTTLSSGLTETTATGAIPIGITLADIYDWAEEGDAAEIPAAKIPNLSTAKIQNLGEYVEDRVANHLVRPGNLLQWVYDDAAGTLTPNILTDTAGIRQVIENVIVEPAGGLTRVYNSGLHTLTLGLDLETLVQVGANMVKSYDDTTGVLSIDALGGGGTTGITAAQARLIAIDAVQVGGGIIRSSGPDNVTLALNNEVMLDTVAAALITSGNITIDYQDAQNQILFSTDALNETEVDLRIDTLIPVNHRIPAGGANKQALVKASSTNRDVEWFSFSTSSVINVTDISLNDQVRAPTQRATALAIQGAIGTGSDNNYVDDITHSFSGQDLTLTLSRSGGLIDLFEVITIPSTGGGVALSDDDPVSVGISSNDPGSATDAARRDHRHQVGRASATQFGVSTYATDAEALAGTSTTHAINPVSLAHVLANSGGGTADGVVTGGSVSGTESDA